VSVPRTSAARPPNGRCSRRAGFGLRRLRRRSYLIRSQLNFSVRRTAHPGTRQIVTDKTPGKRLAAVLWFVAAGLAFIAVGIRFLADREPKWTVAAGGLFCLVMGFASWPRSQPPPPLA
jgi:hypothetical protein